MAGLDFNPIKVKARFLVLSNTLICLSLQVGNPLLSCVIVPCDYEWMWKVVEHGCHVIKGLQLTPTKRRVTVITKLISDILTGYKRLLYVRISALSKQTSLPLSTSMQGGHHNLHQTDEETKSHGVCRVAWSPSSYPEIKGQCL